MRKGVLGVFLVLLLAACGNESAKVNPQGDTNSVGDQKDTIYVTVTGGRVRGWDKPAYAFIPPDVLPASVEASKIGDFYIDYKPKFELGDEASVGIDLTFRDPAGKQVLLSNISWNCEAQGGLGLTSCVDSISITLSEGNIAIGDLNLKISGEGKYYPEGGRNELKFTIEGGGGTLHIR